MNKKGSNPHPSGVRPNPPPGPPGRTFEYNWFSSGETKDSIRAREDYRMFMKGYTAAIKDLSL